MSQQGQETKKILVSPEQLDKRIVELGEQITAAYQGRKLIMVGVLNGAFIFAADLCRVIDIEVEIDFIRVASYGASTESSGSIRLLMEPKLDMTGKDVLIVEDIVDTGTTMAWLQEHFNQSGARSVKICSLIDKLERRAVSISVDYVGFTLDQGFLVGYGLDCAERFRNLPGIYSLDS
ncbi:hypoxanthine phosphoribosyltransferase [Desulfobulbus rhabdoformis]|uniref:hypoxanthine phosphoribosyltransferase n=1 Tax=Desulfobulbus rhabdoformis TaxID=34032 RepID=UPI001964685C|nr:hypoxanthine phosphoribosyltransferase [Desulfobulbus rhabdoformis]MBM9616086.1 hypoxanthine phosphoribosyltransferase [Desulfobulbus rhabdoformis]